MNHEKFGTTNDYLHAFEVVIAEGIPDKHLALLRAHYEARNHTATWEQLAAAIGYANGNAVNLQYGTFAGRVAREMGITLARSGFWLGVLAGGAEERDEVSGHASFILRRPVIEALTRLGVLAGEAIVSVPDELDAAALVLALSRRSFAAWVFQGNPKQFDIDDYVTRYPELIYWRTPRHQSQIAIGDRAVIWRSGSDSGAIAIGVVVEAPTPGTAVKHPDALGADLWRTNEPDPDEPRTGIQLQEIRLSSQEGFLPRAVVKADPALAGASLITMPNGTVFPLDRTQTDAMERLWGLISSESGRTLFGASEGERKLVSHYRRERSDSLRQKKLAEVIARHGKCVCALCGVDDSSKYPRQFGERIFEVHHLLPLSTAATPVRTTLDDLAVLCASCHRAVHATPAVEENYATLAQHLRGESQNFRERWGQI